MWLTQPTLPYSPTHSFIHHLLGTSSELHTHTLCLYLLLPLDAKQLFKESFPELLCFQSLSHTFPLVYPPCAHTQNHTGKPKQRSRKDTFFPHISCD